MSSVMAMGIRPGCGSWSHTQHDVKTVPCTQSRLLCFNDKDMLVQQCAGNQHNKQQTDSWLSN